MVSYVPSTGVYWHPVQSNRVQNFPFYALESCIGTQDTNQTSEDWYTGFLECGNEHTVYHRAPLRIPNWNPVLCTGRENEVLLSENETSKIHRNERDY
jgi:hypothetical protein